MEFECFGVTEKGPVKPVNQDGFCLKRAQTPAGDLALAVVCDGLGGLEHGEVASSLVVTAFSRWFEEELPLLAQTLGGHAEELLGAVESQWQGMIQRLNLHMLRQEGERGWAMGTTCTAMLAFSGRFCVLHVGDTRLFEIADGALRQLTMDHTYVAKEVAEGHLAQEEALIHPQRNMLLQCVGASRVLSPQVMQGVIREGAQYLLCSDGFRNLLTEEEMLSALVPCSQKDALCRLVNACLARGERDNMTAVLLRAANGGGGRSC